MQQLVRAAYIHVYSHITFLVTTVLVVQGVSGVLKFTVQVRVFSLYPTSRDKVCSLMQHHAARAHSRVIMRLSDPVSQIGSGVMDL